MPKKWLWKWHIMKWDEARKVGMVTEWMQGWRDQRNSTPYQGNVYYDILYYRSRGASAPLVPSGTPCVVPNYCPGAWRCPPYYRHSKCKYEA